MSYYPLLQAPYCTGNSTLYNFPPNHWEITKKSDKYISLTYMQNNVWRNQTITTLRYNQHKTISHQDISASLPKKTLALLSLSSDKLPKISEKLPLLSIQKTTTPAWRASLTLKNEFTQTSYQGEINPFPSKASLLTFAPFLQFGQEIENYVLLLNVEKKAISRQVEIKIYDAYDKKLKSTQNANSNNISIISLDGLGFDKNNLPVIVCKDMAAIPLYFSCKKNGKFLSLEHTHPPASLVVHGNRFSVQKHLKKYWFLKLK